MTLKRAGRSPGRNTPADAVEAEAEAEDDGVQAPFMTSGIA